MKCFAPPQILDETDASILVYKFRPERTGFNMYAEYTRPQLTFLANATLVTLVTPIFKRDFFVVAKPFIKSCNGR